jgi:hypothetical protein
VILAILVIKVDQHIPVHTVRSQQNQYDEIRDEQRDIEAVRVIKALKRAVEEVLADVRANSLGGKDGGKRCQIRNEQTSQARCSTRTHLRPLLKLFILPEAGMKAPDTMIPAFIKVGRQALQEL